MSVLMDELLAADIEPLQLPLPSDPRAVTAATTVLATPAEEGTTDDLARRAGMSARTLERLFRAETGMPFGLWRQKARLLESVRLLVEGGSVDRCGARFGLLERQRLHRGVQADVRVHAGSHD
jgi:transcriptional regulator GlxA family with amidase domain